MDDLSSLDWSSKPANSNQARPNGSTAARGYVAGSQATPDYSVLTPSSLSRPASRPASSLNIVRPTVKSSSPANDSFASLVAINPAKAQNQLSLQDRQRQLAQERDRQIREQQERHRQDAQLWDTLSGNKAEVSHKVNGHVQAQAVSRTDDDDDDILAAFNADVKVDRSSNFPPPSSNGTSARTTPFGLQTNGADHDGDPNAKLMAADDDPFGLGSMPQRAAKNLSRSSNAQNDDDILGDLAKPWTPRAASPRRHETTEMASKPTSRNVGQDPMNRAMAELVDMGFAPEKAREALLETDNNVQSAVSWLLNQAHDESRQKSRASSRPSEVSSPARNGSTRRPTQADDEHQVPAWMKQDSRSSSSPRRQQGPSQSGEKDASQFAQEYGAALFKSANSLWKQGQKKMQKAVAEFQQPERDASQPRWMQDESIPAQSAPRPVNGQRRTQEQAKQAANMTDEALLLESRDARPQRSAKQLASMPKASVESLPPSRGRSPAQPLPDRITLPQKMQQPVQSMSKPVSRVSKEAIEEQASQAYVSSSRRRRPPSTQTADSEVDLFAQPAIPQSQSIPATSSRSSTVPTRASQSSSTIKPRLQAPTRSIPSVSPSALTTSSRHRKAGTEAFKRGDYDTAHTSYTSALAPLPPTHPIVIVVLSNRALTAIKTGDPKSAVSDSDRALSLIGPARGEGETIDLGSEGVKDMKEFYGKALTRKAEALEHMERWIDAGNVWREAVENGVGGLVAVRGRDRCAKAANPEAPKVVAAKPAVKAAPLARRLPPRTTASAPPASDGEAVRRLRAANLAAEKADDEKFALADSVGTRVEAWRGGKSDNLRALLGSLDTVLWEEAGWKKVGLNELVLPNKVKIVYMKAIAKVHPDKIPQDATTVQKMVSGSVFATLNEAWDKFKRDNGL